MSSNTRFVAGIGLILILATLVPDSKAQNLAADPSGVAELLPVVGISRNSVSNLHAEGDSLWVGPFLNLTPDEGQTWFLADADSLLESQNRVFSIDVEGNVVVAGLGFNFRDESAGRVSFVPSAGGFLISTDGGENFDYRFPPLDLPGDSVVQFGNGAISALPIIVPQQSPPYDIDYDPIRGEIWTAGWASGVRVSRDFGRTWHRVVLPPDELESISIDSSYDFRLEPRRGNTGSFNHMGFAVLVDETGTVWAGTPAGVNRSTDGGLSWQRFSRDGTPNSLTGSWVISIEEQPTIGRNPIWMATWNAGEAGERGVDGITITRDGGETFEQVLLGETIFDFAFDENRVYAAGEQGLFISTDDGRTWNTTRDFRDPARPDVVVRPDVEVFAVATTSDAVWVGTSDGLFRSEDGGVSWQAFRTDVPVRPEQPSNVAPRVEAYAYPNPFSPAADRLVRFRFEAEQGGVEIRIFDFGMNLVRTLRGADLGAGERELAWDGTDDDGLRVPNGPYFYAVEVGGDEAWGKLLVLE